MKTKYKFSGHQTFTFRYGWLEKGIQGIEQQPDLFSRNDALVTLGVGKNMVDSIKHWCQVAQLLEPVETDGKNPSKDLKPTFLAQKLLLNGGWDPYLEDDASLWLIHWLIVTNPSFGTSWQILFSKFNRPDFTRREITNYVQDFIARSGLKAGNSVITRDIDCLIRTYMAGSVTKKPSVIEETLSCPLIQLNLIQSSPDNEIYRFTIGPKPSLPSAVFAFALDQFFASKDGRAKTISIQECLYGEGSPGQVFKLDENSLIEYVEIIEDATGGSLTLDETAGLKQIYRRQDFDAVEQLAIYYAGKSES